MPEQLEPADAPPALPALKIVEPEVDAENPWVDDVLERQRIARRLSEVVWEQDAPFVMSVDGRWGTGKTFLLKRWQQDLENDGWQAIYYNAWEDDFAGDPLLSIAGQLSERLGTEKFSEKVRGALGQLVRPVYFAGSVVSTATIGMPLPGLPGGDQTDTDHLGDYHEMRAARDELKQTLKELAAEVRSETGQPLLFIVDELDRCRPTFAIGLLERVKHIFDVDNIVFVFGINRGELTKSLRSVYGEIDAGTYLRRFFDMEFVLPDADPEPFCASLVRRFRLDDFFENLSKTASSDYHVSELRAVSSYLPVIVATMGLSLRDIDYCIRLLALTARTLAPRQTVHPALFVVLAAIKIESPQLYHRFIAGSARGAEIVDYMNGRPAAPYVGSAYTERDVRRILTNIEGALYCADNPQIVMDQLDHLAQGADLDRREYLSSETAGLDAAAEGDLERIKHMADVVRMYRKDTEFYGIGRSYLAERIDIYYGMTRQ